MNGRRLLTAFVAVALVATGCSDDDPDPQGAGTATTAAGGQSPGPGPDGSSTAPEAPADVGDASARLVKVADVSVPVAMAVRSGDESVYVAEKGGRVRRVPRGQTASPGATEGTPVLDLSGEVSNGGEQACWASPSHPTGEGST